MSDDETMLIDEHRPTPDGTRPLEIGQRTRSLTAELLEGEPRPCWSQRMADYLHVAPPAHCRLVVSPGDHFILWTEHDLNSRPTGRTEAYCAPCAVAEWRHADVREATA